MKLSDATYGVVNANTVVSLPFTASKTATDVAYAGVTVSDTDASTHVLSTDKGLVLNSSGAGTGSIKVSIPSALADTLSETGTLIMEVSPATFKTSADDTDNEDWLFAFGDPSGTYAVAGPTNNVGGNNGNLPGLSKIASTLGGDKMCLRQDHDPDNVVGTFEPNDVLGLSPGFQLIPDTPAAGVPPMYQYPYMRIVWSWTTTESRLWINGLETVRMPRFYSETPSSGNPSSKYYTTFNIAGHPASANRSMGNGSSDIAIKSVQLIAEAVEFQEAKVVQYAGMLGSSYLAGNSQTAHPQFRDNTIAGQVYESTGVQTINWAKKYLNGYQAGPRDVQQVDDAARATAGFDGGFAPGFAIGNGKRDRDPICYNQAQDGSRVLEALGIGSAPTDSELATASGNYTYLLDKMTGDGVSTSNTILVCDFGANEISEASQSGSVPTVVTGVAAATLDFANSYKSLIRVASDAGFAGMVIDKVPSMTLNSTVYPSNYNDAYVKAFNEAIDLFPTWAKTQGISMPIAIADTFTPLGGFDPNQDLFNTADIHPNESGGLIQGDMASAAFNFLAASIETSGGGAPSSIISNKIITR